MLTSVFFIIDKLKPKRFFPPARSVSETKAFFSLTAKTCHCRLLLTIIAAGVRDRRQGSWLSGSVGVRLQHSTPTPTLHFQHFRNRNPYSFIVSQSGNSFSVISWNELCYVKPYMAIFHHPRTPKLVQCLFNPIWMFVVKGHFKWV